MKLPRRTRSLGAAAPAGVVGAEVAVDHRADLDELARAAQRVDARPLGVGARRGRRGPVRHQHAQQPLRADRLGDEVRDERRVDAARQPEHEPLEAGLAELAADELADDPPRDVRVDRELGRAARTAARRVIASLRGPASAAGTCRASRHARSGSAEPDRRSSAARRRAPARRRRRPWCRAASPPARRRSAPARGPRSSGRSSRSSGSATRSRRTSARSTSTVNRPSSNSGALRQRLAARRDDLRAAPERDRLVDADAVAEHDERRRQLGVRPHQRPPRASPCPSPTSFVAARSRPGDDETLIRTWAPSRASSCGTVRCQKSSQTAMPRPDPEPRRRRPQHVARGEEPPLVEQAVGRQEQLAVDVPDLAVLEQRGGDEQPVVGRLLDERDDRRQVRASRAASRPGAGRRAASRPRRRGPGAGSRSGRAPGTRPGPAPSPRARREQLVVAGEVLVERAEPRARSGRARCGAAARAPSHSASAVCAGPSRERLASKGAARRQAPIVAARTVCLLGCAGTPRGPPWRAITVVAVPACE